MSVFIRKHPESFTTYYELPICIQACYNQGREYSCPNYITYSRGLIPEKKLKQCSVCKTAKYCSIECQRQDFKKHKIQCTEFKSLMEPVRHLFPIASSLWKLLSSSPEKWDWDFLCAVYNGPVLGFFTMEISHDFEPKQFKDYPKLFVPRIQHIPYGCRDDLSETPMGFLNKQLDNSYEYLDGLNLVSNNITAGVNTFILFITDSSKNISLSLTVSVPHLSPLPFKLVNSAPFLFSSYCHNRECNLRNAHKVCSKCKIAVYCCKECQVKDWPDHKHFCKWFYAK